MKFTYDYHQETSQRLREFLKGRGFSKGLLAKVKFQGGTITVNEEVENVLYLLKAGDRVTVDIPPELPHETVRLDSTPVDVIYEDEHLLVVNKPSNVPSIPAQYHPNGTMANRVKNYYVTRHYENQVIHIVTRLDRDTTGLMLFAKHGFAHALMDQQLRKKLVLKEYVAFVADPHQRLQDHEIITGDIYRDPQSILRRAVTTEVNVGKPALTECWLEQRKDGLAKVRIRLHTGRTHQIRVHFTHLGCPLLGDELYEGDLTSIQRQALHCQRLSFLHPITQAPLDLTCPLPPDLLEIEEHLC